MSTPLSIGPGTLFFALEAIISSLLSFSSLSRSELVQTSLSMFSFALQISPLSPQQGKNSDKTLWKQNSINLFPLFMYSKFLKHWWNVWKKCFKPCYFPKNFVLTLFFFQWVSCSLELFTVHMGIFCPWQHNLWYSLTHENMLKDFAHMYCLYPITKMFSIGSWQSLKRDFVSLLLFCQL